MFSILFSLLFFFFLKVEDGIGDFCLSGGLGDVYKGHFKNRLWTAAAMGSHNKPIRQALEEVNRDVRNALSKVDTNSKDHE